MPSRTVTVAAADLPAYIAGLPRLLTENLTIDVSGTLEAKLDIRGFYGSGSISINGSDGCTFQKGVTVNNCDALVTLRNLEFSGYQGANNAIVNIGYSQDVYMSNCTVTGSRSADTEGEEGVGADMYSSAHLSGCGIKNCKTAILVMRNSIVSVYNNSGDSFSGNATGPYVYHGGIILLSGSTPELLGGATNAKVGGLIVKGDGTLL